MWIFALGVWVVLVLAWKNRRPRMVPVVTIDDEGVHRTLVDGRTEAIRWAELVRVEILTTSGGPMLDDLFWILVAGDGTGCAISSADAPALLARLQRLPRFDNIAVLESCGCTDDRRFLAWEGTAGDALA